MQPMKLGKPVKPDTNKSWTLELWDFLSVNVLRIIRHHKTSAFSIFGHRHEDVMNDIVNGIKSESKTEN